MAATQEEVDRVLSAYDIAKEVPEYAASIVLEMQQIRGEDYRLIWTNQYPTN